MGTSGVSEMPDNTGANTTSAGAGSIALPGFGPKITGRQVGEHGGPGGVSYGTKYVSSAQEIKSLFVSLYNSKDSRIAGFIESAGGYNAAKTIWNKAADYTYNLASGNSLMGDNAAVNFFDILYSDQFAKSITTATSGSTSGPMSYVSLTDAATARADLLKDMQNYAGRKPTEAEYKDYIKKLNSEQKKAATKQSVSGSTQTTTRSGFDEEAFRVSYIVKKLNLTTEALPPSKARATLESIDLAARDYGIGKNITSSTKSDLTKKMLTGEIDETKLREKFADIAASAFPVFADRLKAGEGSLREIASPYVATYANLLELDDNAIDIKDVVNKATNSMNGKAELYSLFDYEKVIRKDDRYQYTKQANAEAAAFGQAFARAMGVNL